ncbi:MAG: hypothetical protein IT289_09765 [Oligoflexia bacterium]|nr:hypothetical protein [Oligoflexia bacterium]
MSLLLRRQKGQAVVEYVLLLGVVVLIILGIMYRFVSSFGVFMDRIFIGEESYLACLIKNGVLPGDAAGQCQPPRWSLQDGRPPPNTSGPAITQPGGPAAPPPLTGGTGPGAGNQENQLGGNLSGGARARDRAGGENIVPAPEFDSARGSGVGSNLGGEASEAYTGSDKVSSGSTGAGGGESFAGGGSGIRSDYVPAGRISGKALGSKSQDVPLTERDKKSAATIDAEKKARALAEENAKNPWSIGEALRWLLIIALIVAIIFFVGTQLVAVARGNKR